MSDPVRFGRDADGNAQSAGQPSPQQQQAYGKRRRKNRVARNQFVVFFNFLFSSLVFSMMALGAALYFGKVEFESVGPHDVGATYTVRTGANVAQIANGLRREGLISNSRIFEYGVRAYRNENDLKAGEYDIAAGASMKEIMDKLVEGKAILYPLTVVEGWTVFRAIEEIKSNEFLTGEVPAELPPEGSLIADTQKFGRGTDRTELIARMRAQQERIVSQIWEKRNPDLPVETMEEFVTLASIVEKETGVAEERPRVAAVFVNRLNRGMRLQSDPTIIYGIFGGEGKPSDRPIYRSDIDTPTDYNTYTINGLPPGPIAIPGRASLEAVANPAQTNDLYFVADGTGGHAFAETLEEHNQNVARWRQIEREREAQ